MRGGPHRLMPATDEKAKNRGQVVGRLVRLLAPYRWQVIGSLVFMLISAASQGGGPFLIGRAIDAVISVGDRSGLVKIMLQLALVYIMGMVATRFQILLLSKAGQSLLAGLRQSVFDKVESLSLQFLESSQAGEIMSRLTNDIDALNNFFSQALGQMTGALFALIGIVVAMLSLNWELGLAVLVMVPVLLLTTNLFSRLARNAYRKTRTTIGDVSANLEEELGGVKVAQAFNRTDVNMRRFAERNAANRDANVNATAVTSAFSPAMDLLSTLDTALVAAMGGAMAISGRISVGVVVSFLQYVQNFFRPIQTVAQMWTLAQSGFAAAERIFELIDMVPAIQDAPDAIDLKEIEGKIVFDHVCFGYDEDEDVLKDVSFEARPGQTIAIVGPTGAGKTTTVGLIARFYDPLSGRVLIDGHDIRNITQHSLRSQMGIVTQEPFLFSGTLIENIRYGRLNATDDEVIEAARAANAEDFISRLPQKFQTDVGERGKLLSQGQRQLVAIARAVLANPRILVMDEATASVDTRTEVLIQQALQKLLTGCRRSRKPICFW
jgi:ATP-binding cassette subfamily B multidrug efflux pump